MTKGAAASTVKTAERATPTRGRVKCSPGRDSRRATSSPSATASATTAEGLAETTGEAPRSIGVT